MGNVFIPFKNPHSDKLKQVRHKFNFDLTQSFKEKYPTQHQQRLQFHTMDTRQIADVVVNLQKWDRQCWI